MDNCSCKATFSHKILLELRISGSSSEVVRQSADPKLRVAGSIPVSLYCLWQMLVDGGFVRQSGDRDINVK